MAKKQVFTRKDAERLHAKKRAEERYGITYTKELRRKLIDAIQSNKGYIHRRSQSNTRKVITITLDGMTYKLVYNTSTHNIVTFLPLEERISEHEV